MYKKILVPLDGSPLAEAALPHAKAVAQSERAELILLRVAVDPGAEFAFADPAIASDVVQQMEAETKKYMADLTAKLQAEGFTVTPLIREGPIAETILAVADDMRVDLIAMSTHGRSGVQRWLMGSVADRVVHHCKVPVILVRPNAS